MSEQSLPNQNKVGGALNSILELPDHLFMLALSVREENLKDPARWCSEMRDLAKARKEGPKNSAEAAALLAWSDRLASEANGNSNV